MGFQVLFKKRIMDTEYNLGTYESYTLAKVVAKGEYHYRGGCTPTYRIIKSNNKTHNIPEYLYDILTRVVGYLTSEEQEVFKEHHLKYLKKKGLI